MVSSYPSDAYSQAIEDAERLAAGHIPAVPEIEENDD